MRSRISIAWLYVGMMTVVLWFVGVFSAVAQTTNDVSEAEKAVRRLFLEKNPRLTSLKLLSATNNFEFKVAFTRSLPAANGSTNRITSMLTVVVEESRAAIMVTTTNGLPYCFLGDGFYAGFDPEQPGRLLVQNNGHALFRFSYHGDNKIEVGLAFAPEIELPKCDIDLNLAGAFEVISSRANMIYTDKNTKAVMLTLDGGAVFAMHMLPPENPDPFGVSSIKLENSRSAVEIGNIVLGKPPGALLKVTQDAVKLSGVPCRDVRPDEMKRLPLLVAPDFPRNEAERKAAQTLLDTVFKSK